MLDTIRKVAVENSGMLLVATAQGFLSLTNVIVKFLNASNPPIPFLELIWARMVVTWACCIMYMYIHLILRQIVDIVTVGWFRLFMKVPHPFLGPKSVRSLLILGGLSGFVGVSGSYCSLQYLSLSDATVLTFLAPNTTAIAAAILLGETLYWKHVMAGARPQFLFERGAYESTKLDNGVTGSQRLIAVGAATVNVLGATGAYTSIRAIGERAHALHSLLSYSSQSVIWSSVAMFFLRVQVIVPPTYERIILLLIIGLLGYIAQFLLMVGLQREPAGRGTVAIYVQMVFAIVFERVFFNTIPTPLSVLGMVIIMSSALYVALSTTRASINKRRHSVLPSGNNNIPLDERLQNNREDVLDEGSYAKR
ncbi:hypothetical protein NM688_g823 [Phlebia brevispora]|uniref:Uncharacterized protein n=1 Tax=Phlebia brevispora TaxID=194682 RepID=A0ACC1TE04_9APHY|nr:hypothetical protein NM688_g823 [Phlebia brevispora]